MAEQNGGYRISVAIEGPSKEVAAAVFEHFAQALRETDYSETSFEADGGILKAKRTIHTGPANV